MEVNAQMEEASAIYEPVLPMGWIGERPVDHELAWQPKAEIPQGWCDAIVVKRLRCGIEVIAQTRGFVIYDFSGWSPGIARPAGTPAIRRFSDVSKAAKPALIQRLRVINTHLTLVHSAAMSLLDESPTVMRAHERDLYRFDYPDDGGDGYWYRPLGHTLPTEVTMADRERIGTVSSAIFETSLDWLDRVVTAQALVEFDLLNQTQTALDTHDYSLAVVAGWTVCELRTRALGRNVPGGQAREVSKVCEALKRSGQISSQVKGRLDRLRDQRNGWLHSGKEPDEETALESLALATELLRTIIGQLATRATNRLLLL